MLARNAAYDAGALRGEPTVIPSVGLGNLASGGVGKTPLAAYLARELLRRGAKPAVLLRGYGCDEARELSRLVPEAAVVADANRHAGAARAASLGACVAVLDDCLQRRDVVPDIMLAVLSLETMGPVRYPLPAGPWREGLGALGRAEAVVVTWKSGSEPEAARLAAELATRTRVGVGMVAQLAITSFRGLEGDETVDAAALRGRTVVALCGVGEPELFAAQLESLGASVRLLAHGDHHAFTDRDVRSAISAAGADGVVVTTGKDAVKLEHLWPVRGPGCLVASLEVRFTRGAETLAAWLDRLAASARQTSNDRAAGAPRTSDS
jgi:tetraacyldisaccharide 4'-kinase